MPSFSAYDGTVLAYHVSGTGDPVVCLPGGPMQASAYLGDLGGLPAHRQMITLDLRGTGGSAIPDDPGSYRCDRLVDDVEALREHLGLDRLDLLGHSAGTNLAVLYAARHPTRVARLALITPSAYAAGVTVAKEARLAVARLRADEPWYEPAYAALQAIMSGAAPEEGASIDPFFHGRWDAAAQAHQAATDAQRNAEAAAVFGSAGAYDPEATRAALAAFAAPVLVLAGEVDLNTPPDVAAEIAALFPAAELVVQPGAGHFPWMDDGPCFVASTTAFLG